MSFVSSMDRFKFIMIVLVCGTGMFVIPHHIAYVGQDFAIANRMLLAGSIICAYAFYKGIPFPKMTLRALGAFCLSGMCLYSVNYFLIYKAIMGLPSGICALVIAAIIVPNAIFGALILKTKMKHQTMVGAFLSLMGLLILFPGDLLAFDMNQATTYSFTLMFLSIFLSSFGTVMTSKFMRNGYDFYWMTGIAMLVGGAISFSSGVVFSDIIPWSWDTMHLATWLYMSIPCTAVFFIFYMRIVNKFGAGNASYVWILAPTIALLLSHMFENMAWTLERILGTGMILLGSLVSIYKPRVSHKVQEPYIVK